MPTFAFSILNWILYSSVIISFLQIFECLLLPSPGIFLNWFYFFNWFYWADDTWALVCSDSHGFWGCKLRCPSCKARPSLRHLSSLSVLFLFGLVKKRYICCNAKASINVRKKIERKSPCQNISHCTSINLLVSAIERSWIMHRKFTFLLYSQGITLQIIKQFPVSFLLKITLHDKHFTKNVKQYLYYFYLVCVYNFI